MHAAAGARRAGQGQDDRAIRIGDSLFQDAGGPGGVARGEGHLLPGVDHAAAVKGGDVDMFDRVGQQLGLAVRFVAHVSFLKRAASGAGGADGRGQN